MDGRDLVTVLVVAVAVLSTAIVYGTDVFAAWVLRPAVDRSGDAAVVDVVGHLHVFGDVRMPVPGTVSLLATAAGAVLCTSLPGRIGAAVALAALLGWTAVYLRVSWPVNRMLGAAATAHDVPAAARAGQDRWNAVIGPRAALQAVAMLGLLLALVSR